MYNIAEELQKAELVTGERIIAIIIGRHDRNYDALQPDEGVLLTREIGLAKLNYDYNDDFGRADCHPMFAWTDSRVYFIYEYDGATSIFWLPRNPEPRLPEFSGLANLGDNE